MDNRASKSMLTLLSGGMMSVSSGISETRKLMKGDGGCTGLTQENDIARNGSWYFVMGRDETLEGSLCEAKKHDWVSMIEVLSTPSLVIAMTSGDTCIYFIVVDIACEQFANLAQWSMQSASQT